MTVLPLGPSPVRRKVLARRIRWFVAATITYNVIEAIVALSAGAKASSAALIGFGLDSVIELSSAAAVAWQFAAVREGIQAWRGDACCSPAVALSPTATQGACDGPQCTDACCTSIDTSHPC